MLSGDKTAVESLGKGIWTELGSILRAVPFPSGTLRKPLFSSWQLDSMRVRVGRRYTVANAVSAASIPFNCFSTRSLSRVNWIIIEDTFPTVSSPLGGGLWQEL
jgi:hypothetical protein